MSFYSDVGKAIVAWRNSVLAARIVHRERFEQWLARSLVKLAAVPGKFKLTRQALLRILIDNSVLRHGQTHTNAWISTGTKLWGGVVPIDTGYRARVPRECPRNQSGIYEGEIPFFAPLAQLVADGYLHLFTSRELLVERARQPSYDAYMFGFNVWKRVKIDLVPDPPRSLAYGSIITKEWYSAEAQTQRVLQACDADFRQLSRHVHQKHLLDLFHVWTAKHSNCAIFLTTDKQLQRVIQNLPAKARVLLEPVRVMSPSELGRELKLHPVAHRLLTPLDSDWFYVMR